MKGKDLEEIKEAWGVRESKRRARPDVICAGKANWGLANTGENSTPYLSC
jgi:hypothetical protein